LVQRSNIHLNPVRAGVVKSLGKLDRYPVVRAQCEILSPFGLKKREAVRRYREFIKDGFNMGRLKI